MRRDKREICIVRSSTAEYLKEKPHTSSDQNRTQVRR